MEERGFTVSDYECGMVVAPDRLSQAADQEFSGLYREQQEKEYPAICNSLVENAALMPKVRGSLAGLLQDDREVIQT